MCTEYYTGSELIDMSVKQNIPLDNEYPGPRTGKKETCVAQKINNSLGQESPNRPYIISYDYLKFRDNALEDELLKGPVLTMIGINKKLL